MSEETISQPNQPVAATPEAKPLTSRDLLIPVSIIVAGLFVGAGLYFGGGGSGSPVIAVDTVNQPVAEAVDNTGKVNPVTENDHIKGSLAAKVKVVEFSDFDCPFCSRFHDVMNAVMAKYSGDEVAWVYRQFPLEQLHPNAPAIALASECVSKLGGNDAFWTFADGYFSAKGSGDSTPANELIPKLVLQAGVSGPAFTECFDNKELASEVQDDMNNAVETGGRGTPWSIIIGPTGKTYPINGALPQSAVEQLIEVALKEA
ncbi:thioredoxin domain-containing protein [Candidatus Nomurabacteria bacterium]|nr:thioredoxin domain-containing protein [Candidatus Kaiserbacteria bacterium]MCB9815254.1 thioredoxin domain-containing protein [Candidatus Nomurabacteria bacterium]